MLPMECQSEREKAQSCRVGKRSFCNVKVCAMVAKQCETPNLSPAHCHTCTPSPMRRPATSEPAHFCLWAGDAFFHVTAFAFLFMSGFRGNRPHGSEGADTCRSSNSPLQSRHWPFSQAALIQMPSARSRAQRPEPSSPTRQAEARRLARSLARLRARSATTLASVTDLSSVSTRSHLIATPRSAAPGRGVLF